MVLCEALWEGARLKPGRGAKPNQAIGWGRVGEGRLDGEGMIVVEGGARPSSARKVDTSSQKVLRL